METYFYKCPLCGFMHFIPAYWVSFAPEEEMEFEHVDAKSDENCSNVFLKLVKG